KCFFRWLCDSSRPCTTIQFSHWPDGCTLVSFLNSKRKFRMKRIAVFTLLLAWSVAWSLPAKPQGISVAENTPESREAAKNQQKAMKKNEKARRKSAKNQRKAMKKYEKTQRKLVKNANLSAKSKS